MCVFEAGLEEPTHGAAPSGAIKGVGPWRDDEQRVGRCTMSFVSSVLRGSLMCANKHDVNNKNKAKTEAAGWNGLDSFQARWAGQLVDSA